MPSQMCKSVLITSPRCVKVSRLRSQLCKSVPFLVLRLFPESLSPSGIYGFSVFARCVKVSHIFIIP